jgi:nicotinamide phosphoribosyltransferase
MKNVNCMLLADFYKISHRMQYPKGIEYCYSTWTPRASRMKDVNEVVVFGLQAFIKDKLISLFDNEFFNKKKEDVVSDYKRIIKNTLGVSDPETTHIEELHDLGYLPLLIKALPEGTVVPLRVPTMTIQNTNPKFFWLTNYIETLASCELWQPSTSATIAREYRKLLDKAALTTVGNTDFVQFQGHDFSMRGMSSLSSAVSSGMGHLLSFVGTDTVPAIQGLEQYYNANVEKELVGTSIPATEHSIQCSYGDDMEYFRKMINEVHPTGMVSIVSDGYDFWDVMTRVLPALKEDILKRDGKVVIRPDSGDPVKIVCGDPEAPAGSPERKGAMALLWDIFSGDTTPKGHRQINPKVGLIYGDAITLRRAEEIVNNLAEQGFASTNVVFGIGSFTYQYNTRDTFGYALKSTAIVVDGIEKPIFKDPKTDDGIKKSQKGRVAVLRDGNSYRMVDGLSLNDNIGNDCLKTVFLDGKLLVDHTLSEVRNRLKEHT